MLGIYEQYLRICPDQAALREQHLIGLMYPIFDTLTVNPSILFLFIHLLFHNNSLRSHRVLTLATDRRVEIPPPYSPSLQEHNSVSSSEPNEAVMNRII